MAWSLFLVFLIACGAILGYTATTAILAQASANQPCRVHIQHYGAKECLR